MAGKREFEGAGGDDTGHIKRLRTDKGGGLVHALRCDDIERCARIIEGADQGHLNNVDAAQWYIKCARSQEALALILYTFPGAQDRETIKTILRYFSPPLRMQALRVLLATGWDAGTLGLESACSEIIGFRCGVEHDLLGAFTLMLSHMPPPGADFLWRLVADAFMYTNNVPDQWVRDVASMLDAAGIDNLNGVVDLGPVLRRAVNRIRVQRQDMDAITALLTGVHIAQGADGRHGPAPPGGGGALVTLTGHPLYTRDVLRAIMALSRRWRE
jgi:hypothetical protein